jgi:hypothetical protein
MEEKYPKGYLTYYLSLFANHFDKPIIENYQVCTQLYIQLLGPEELQLLKKEIKQIIQNEDQQLFVKFMNYKQFSSLGNKQLMDLMKQLEKFKL